MAERRPLSRGYHPLGLFVMAGGGIAAGLFDIFVNDRPLRFYAIAAALVVPCQLLQLWLDYRHTEQWYAVATTAPFEPTLEQRLRLRWPAMLSLVTIPFVGICAFAAAFFGALIFFYPWQRALYRRSYREFKSPPPRTFGFSAEKWEAVRARGRKRVVLQLAIGGTLFMAFVFVFSDASGSAAWSRTAILIFLLPVYFALAVCVASHTWRKNEQRYREQAASADSR